MTQNSDIASRIQRIRAELDDDARTRFDVDLHETIVSVGESGDFQPLDQLIEAWSRVAISYELGGTAWTAVEALLRRGAEPEWDDEPRYRIVHTREFSSLVGDLSLEDRASLSQLSARLARDPFPRSDESELAIEPFGSLPHTYSVRFRSGVLVYVVPPQRQIIGFVLVYQPLRVSGWGRNDWGTLGDGTNQNRALPVQALGMINGRSIAAGSQHSLYVDDLTSRVWSWGDNSQGQLGDGTITNRSVPFQLPGLSNVSYVSARGYTSMAVKNDGTVWTWGALPASSYPSQVPGLADVQRIACGWFHGLALKSDGTVWAWGSNLFGQLGDGTTTYRPTPVLVSGLTDVTAIAATDGANMALKADGTVWAWGFNGHSELGDGTSANRSLPVQVGGLPGPATAIGISSHGLAALADGTLWSWGSNVAGQLGDGLTSPTRPVPAQVSGLQGVIGVAAGLNFSLARTTTGQAWAWGDNAFGKLGDGSTTDRRSPVPVMNLTRVRDIAADYWHALALVAP